MSGFEAGSGFSVGWIHFWSLMITGCFVSIIGAALITCLVHKLNDGAIQHGSTLIIYMLFIGMIVAIMLGVLKTM